VVDHDVANGADRVVEAAAIRDTEVLGHRDLNAVDAVAIPDGLEDRIGEAQEEDLRQPHQTQEVVDAVELVLSDVLVDLPSELACGFEVVSEWLLDDDPRGLGEPGVVEPLDGHPEERGRDLQIEDRRARTLDLGR
jgi:hypothetical protein